MSETSRGTLRATLNNPTTLKATLNTPCVLEAFLTIPRVIGTVYPPYSGPHEVVPDFIDHTLETRETLVMDDITVREIPVAEVENLAGGYTVTIGG